MPPFTLCVYTLDLSLTITVDIWLEGLTLFFALWCQHCRGDRCKCSYTPIAMQSISLACWKLDRRAMTADAIPWSPPPPQYAPQISLIMPDTREEEGLWFQVCMAVESTPASQRIVCLFLLHSCCQSSFSNIWGGKRYQKDSYSVNNKPLVATGSLTPDSGVFTPLTPCEPNEAQRNEVFS